VGQRLCFGPFELDPHTGELWRRGAALRLQQQPATVLALLASRPGELVTRDELKRALWPDGTYVDFDGGLNFCINRIRRLLGEDARRPVYVETLPGRGYRFIAHVTGKPPASAGAPAAPEAVPAPPAAPPVRRRGAWRVALAASLLAAALVTAPSGSVARRRDTSPQGPGRAAYLRGLYQATMARQPRASLESFQEAARLEAGSAGAHAALAEAWVREVEEGRVPPRQGMPQARAAAERAVALADDAAGHRVLGTVALRYEWDWASAERSLRRSLSLEPSSPRAHLELSDLLLVQGRRDEAVRLALQAEQLDPVCPVVGGRVAGSYYAARRFDEAAHSLRHAATLAPALVGPHERLFHAYRHAARAGEAVDEASRVMAMVGAPAPAGFLSVSARERSMAQFLDGTLRFLRGDAARAPGVYADRMAVLHAALGQRAEALRWLERAAAERCTTLPVTLATDPDLDALRGDDGFRSLLRRVRLAS
jgi:DNA-binding winged helix-turn-helix (wHTH) protein/Flp pilus assembly protein TadD